MKRVRIEKILSELGDDTDTLDIISKYTAAKRRKKTRDQKRSVMQKFMDLDRLGRLQFTFVGSMDMLNDCDILSRDISIGKNNTLMMKFKFAHEGEFITFFAAGYKTGLTWKYYSRNNQPAEKNDGHVWQSLPFKIRPQLKEKECGAPTGVFRNVGHMVKTLLHNTTLTVVETCVKVEPAACDGNEI